MNTGFILIRITIFFFLDTMIGRAFPEAFISANGPAGKHRSQYLYPVFLGDSFHHLKLYQLNIALGKYIGKKSGKVISVTKDYLVSYPFVTKVVKNNDFLIIGVNVRH